MKALLLIAVLFNGLIATAQHPLEGTWEAVSISGKDAEGKPFNYDHSVFRETKIITPTHYILIQFRVNGDSVIFQTSHAGTVKFNGNRYSETPVFFSDPAAEKFVTDFTWKIEGDKFIQRGTITLPDNRKVVIDELVFKRAKAKVNTKSPLIGTWNQLSSTYTLFDGTKDSHTQEAATRFYIINASHWMMIGHRKGKFENSIGGTYELMNNKMIPTPAWSSGKIDPGLTVSLDYRLDGKKLYWNGQATNQSGQTMIWSDVYEKVVPAGQ